MFHTTLSKGKNIAQGKEKGILLKSKWKGQEQNLIVESKVKRRGKGILVKSRQKDKGKFIIRTLVKGTGEIL